MAFHKSERLPIVYDVNGSYLVGAVHFLPEKLYNERFSVGPKDLVRAYIERSDVGVFEVDTDVISAATTEDFIRSNAFVNPLDVEETKNFYDAARRIAGSIQDTNEISKKALEKGIEKIIADGDVQKLYIAMFGMEIMRTNPVWIDPSFMECAKELSKPIKYLESQSQQIDAFSSMVDTKNHPESVKKDMESFINGTFSNAMEKEFIQFVNGDIEKSDAEILQMVPDLRESLIDRRDARMYGEIKPYLSNSKSFITTGMGHTSGILRMARNDGFSTQRI
jgi:hypothetical protein